MKEFKVRLRFTETKWRDVIIVAEEEWEARSAVRLWNGKLEKKAVSRWARRICSPEESPPSLEGPADYEREVDHLFDPSDFVDMGDPSILLPKGAVHLVTPYAPGKVVAVSLCATDFSFVDRQIQKMAAIGLTTGAMPFGIGKLVCASLDSTEPHDISSAKMEDLAKHSEGASDWATMIDYEGGLAFTFKKNGKRLTTKRITPREIAEARKDQGDLDDLEEARCRPAPDPSAN